MVQHQRVSPPHLHFWPCASVSFIYHPTGIDPIRTSIQYVHRSNTYIDPIRTSIQYVRTCEAESSLAFIHLFLTSSYSSKPLSFVTCRTTKDYRNQFKKTTNGALFTTFSERLPSKQQAYSCGRRAIYPMKSQLLFNSIVLLKTYFQIRA